MKMFQVMTREDALHVLKQAFGSWRMSPAETPVLDAVGMILTQDLVARENLPAFRRSTVDGYAVRARDTHGASDSSPILLHLSGEVHMGSTPATMLSPDCAIQVPTGGALPEGADAMIMVEHTEQFGRDIALYNAVAVRDHVVEAGEDVTVGTTILRKGTRLRASHLGLLAALGVAQVSVASAPRVAILSTGDELASPGETLQPGQVRDSNRIALAALVTATGGCVVHTGQVGDEPAALTDALDEALAVADLVLLSGGSSVGGMDHTEHVLSQFGTPGILVHGLALKPGKPTLIAKLRDKAVFGLPGHPAACVIAFCAVVAPFLATLTDRAGPLFQQVPCIARFQLHASGGRDVYQMVRLIQSNEGWDAEAVLGKSGFVSQISMADAFVVIPRDTEGIQPGDKLWASLLP